MYCVSAVTLTRYSELVIINYCFSRWAITTKQWIDRKQQFSSENNKVLYPMTKTLCPAITTNEMLLKVWYWHHTSGMNGKILFHEESSGGWREYETQPLVEVSALCSIIISAIYPQRFSSGTNGEWKPRRNWKMATKTEAKMLSKATQDYSCSWLEFNVPFQHKYGYIRDDNNWWSS